MNKKPTFDLREKLNTILQNGGIKDRAFLQANIQSISKVPSKRKDSPLINDAVLVENISILSPAQVTKMQEGGGTESEKLARIINPKNWFVKDYTKSGDFNTAFRDAKKAGEEEFIWNNKRYNTKSDLPEEAQMKSYGITDEQRKVTPSGSDRFLYEPIKKASENVSKINTGWGYDIPLKNLALASFGKNSLLPLTQGQGLDWEKNKVYFEEGLPTSMFADYSDSPDSPGAKEQDALRLYLGLPQRYQSFKPSKYKKGAFEIVGYNKKLSKIMPSDEYVKTFGNWSFPGGPNEEFTIKPYADLVMGKHTVKKGKDEKGEYIEYYDKFDFDTYGLIGDISDRLNKPFEIYGRKYYKDYGDGVKREMFYSDKELMSLDPKKKNFDTLALQEELYKRGYNLEGSITKEGDLDGILGEDTINALLDWQSKNRGKVHKKEQGGTVNRLQQMMGYKDNSPYKNLPYQDIYSDRITMSGVSRPLVATTDTGVRTVMQPGGEYYFPGATQVRETPLYSNGGRTKDRENLQTMKLYSIPKAAEGLSTTANKKRAATAKSSLNVSAELEDVLKTLGRQFGVRPAALNRMINKIAYHESAGTFDPQLKENTGGKVWNKKDWGAGLFQYKSASVETAIKRAKKFYSRYNKTIPAWLKSLEKSLDIRDLNADQQKLLAILDMAAKPNFSIKNAVKDDDSLAQEWGRGWQTKSDPIKIKKFKEDTSDYNEYVGTEDPPNLADQPAIAGLKVTDNNAGTRGFAAQRQESTPMSMGSNMATTPQSTIQPLSAQVGVDSLSRRTGVVTPKLQTFSSENANQESAPIEEKQTTSAPATSEATPSENTKNVTLYQTKNGVNVVRDSKGNVFLEKDGVATIALDTTSLFGGDKDISQYSNQEIVNAFKSKGGDTFVERVYKTESDSPFRQINLAPYGKSLAKGVSDEGFIDLPPKGGETRYKYRFDTTVPEYEGYSVFDTQNPDKGWTKIEDLDSLKKVTQNYAEYIGNIVMKASDDVKKGSTVSSPAGTGTSAAEQKDGGDYINMQSKDKDWDYRYNTQTNQWEVKRKKENTWIKVDDTTEAKRKAKPAIEAAYGQDLQAELDKRKKAAADKKAAEDAAKAGGGTGTGTGGAETEGPTTDVTKTDGTTTTNVAPPAVARPATTTTTQAQNYPPINTAWDGKIRSSMQRKIDQFLEERAIAEKSKANIEEIQRKRQELEQLGLPPEFTNTDNTVVPNNTVQKKAEQPVRDYYGPPYVNGGKVFRAEQGMAMPSFGSYDPGQDILGGAKSGMQLGSQLGSFVPGIGQGVGALVGAAIGGIEGGIMGAQNRAIQRSDVIKQRNLIKQQQDVANRGKLFGMLTNMLGTPQLPGVFQEGAQVEAPIYANETLPQVYSTGLNREQLQTPGVKPTFLDMDPLKRDKTTESSQSAAETQVGTGQRIITIKDEDGTPKRVLIDSAGNVIRFIDKPMSEQEKLNRDYQEGEDFAISARNYVEQERKRRAAAALAQNQNPVQQQQGGPIITSLLYRNMDKNNSIKNNISMNKSKLENVINLSNKVNPYRLSPMGVYKNGGLIMEGGVSASRAGFSRQPITGASSTGPLGPKRSEVPSYTNKGVNSIMDLPTNEYVPTENMIPIQAEIGEMIVLPTGDLMPVMARRRHHQMQDDEVTDMTPENSYILSAHGQVRINKDEANLLITETGVKPYRLGQSQNPPTEKTLASVMTKKVMRPAEVAKRINSLFPVLSTDNPFEIAANIENKINRKPYLEGLIQLSELDKYRKGLSEPAMSDLQQQEMQMPQRMPGSPMLARQGRRISRPGVVRAQDSRYIGSGGLPWGYLPDEMGNYPGFEGSLADPYSTAYGPYTGQVVTPRTNPPIYTNLNPNMTYGSNYIDLWNPNMASPANQQFAQGQNQGGIFSALSAPANFAARLIGSQAIRNAERAGIARERGIYEQGFGRMGNLMTAGTAAEAAMLGAQDPFVKWRDIPDTYIRSARTQTPSSVIEAQSAAAFANLPDYGEMGQAGLAAQNAAYARGLEQSSRAIMDAAEKDRAAYNMQQGLLQENLAGNVAGRLAAERATTAAINKMLSGYGSLANRYAQGQIDLTGQRMGANIGLSRAEQASKTGLYQNRLNAFTTFTGDMAAGGEEALKALFKFGG